MKKVASLLWLILIFTSCSKLADGLGDATGVNDDGKVGTSSNKDTGGGNNNSGGNNSGGSDLGDYLANVLVDHAKAESMTFTRDCAAGFTKYVMVDGDKGNYYFCMTTEPVVTQSFTDTYNRIKTWVERDANAIGEPENYTNWLSRNPNAQTLLDDMLPSESNGYHQEPVSFYFEENFCLKRSARVCKNAEMRVAYYNNHFDVTEAVTSGEGWPNMVVNQFTKYNSDDPYLEKNALYWADFNYHFDVATDFNTYCCYH